MAALVVSSPMGSNNWPVGTGTRNLLSGQIENGGTYTSFSDNDRQINNSKDVSYIGISGIKWYTGKGIRELY